MKTVTIEEIRALPGTNIREVKCEAIIMAMEQKANVVFEFNSCDHYIHFESFLSAVVPK